MNYIFIISAGLLVFLNASDVNNKVKWENKTKKVEIKAVGQFSKTTVSSTVKDRKKSATTTAARLTVDKYSFKWRPRWNFVGLGGALIPFALESNDQSVFGIVETLPQKNAPSSSIIVFIDLYELKVINYVVMLGEDVRKFCYIPNSHKIVCLIKSPYNKYFPAPEFQFKTIDTHSTETISSSPIFKEEPVAISSDGKRLFAAFKDSETIRIYPADELSKPYKTVSIADKPVALNHSSDDKRLVVTGKDKITILNIEQQAIPEKTIRLPDFFTPDKAVLCSRDTSNILLSYYGGATYFYNGSKFIKVCKRTDADVNWDNSKGNILVGLPKDSIIASFSTKNLESPVTQFKFRKLRPRSNGKLYKIISLPGQGVAVLDKRGALFHFIPKKQRWYKKNIIAEPEPQ